MSERKDGGAAFPVMKHFGQEGGTGSEGQMTQEDLDATANRLGIAREMNTIEDSKDDTVLQIYERDVSVLLAYVKRLTLERDATVGDLREAITSACDDECRFCRHINSPECAACNTDAENRWEWRGVKETVNG